MVLAEYIPHVPGESMNAVRKRNVSLASVLLAAGTSALVGGALTFAFVHERHAADLQELARQEKQRAAQAINEARRQTHQASRSRELAEELIDFVLEDLRTGLLPIGRTELLSAAGERAVAYFEALPPNQITPETELNRAKVLVTIGQALTDQGDFAGAANRFRAGIAILQGLAAGSPEETELQFELAWSLSEFGILLNKMRDFDGATEANEQALAVFELLAENDPQDVDSIYGIAAGHLGLGTANAGMRNREAALHEYEHCVAQAKRALAAEPGHVLSLQALAVALNDAGLVHLRGGHYAEAISYHQQGCDVMRQLIARDPESRRWEKELATGLNNIGISYDALGKHDEAKPHLAEALTLRQGLAAWDSRNAAWLADLANSWHNMAALHFDLNADAAAYEAARESLAVYHKLTLLEPENESWPAGMEDSHEALARELTKHGRPDAVHELYQILASRAEELLLENPNLRPWEDQVFALYAQAAGTGTFLGEAAPERLGFWKAAVATRTRSFDRHPKNRGARHRLGIAFGTLGLAAREAGLARVERQSLALAHYLVDSAAKGEANRETQRLARHHALALAGKEAKFLVSPGDEWRYRDDAEVDEKWMELEFDDSAWSLGAAPLGYGEGDEATVINFGDDPADKRMTAWFRKAVPLGERLPPDMVLHVGMVCDDGAIVYCNGTEILRHRMPEGPVTAGTPGATAAEPEERDFNAFRLEAGSLPLRLGNNIIAVEVHQNEPISSDLRFDFELIAGLSQARPLEGFDAIEAKEALGPLIPDFLYQELNQFLNKPTVPNNK